MMVVGTSHYEPGKVFMKLTSQDLPDIEDVSEPDIERVLGGEVFGKYAILWSSESGFLQTGFKGRPPDWAFQCDSSTEERRMAEEWREFVQRTGSERWTLEYLDDAADKLYEAAGDRTLEEVKQAFLEYLRGDDVWRHRYTWLPLDG
jgi:hypothetical protein